MYNTETKSLLIKYFINEYTNFIHNMPRTLKEIKKLEKIDKNNKPDTINGSLVQIAEGETYFEIFKTSGKRAMEDYIYLRDRVTREQITWVKPYDLRADGYTQNDVEKVIEEGLIRSQDGKVAKEDYQVLQTYMNFFADLVEKGIIKIADNPKRETWLIAPLNVKGSSKISNKVKIVDEIFQDNFKKYFRNKND